MHRTLHSSSAFYSFYGTDRWTSDCRYHEEQPTLQTKLFILPTKVLLLIVSIHFKRKYSIKTEVCNSNGSIHFKVL